MPEPDRESHVSRGGTFALLLAYTGAMPLVVGGAGLWFLPDIVAVFAQPSIGAVALFTVLTAVALSLALLPATAVAALAGGLFGPLGLVPAVAAYLLACLALFEVVRRFLQPSVQAAVARSPRGRAAQRELQHATFRIVVLSRLSPVLPFALASVLLAVSTAARGTYVGGTLVGMLPRTAVAVSVGTATERAVAGLREGWLPSVGDGPAGLVLPALAAIATLGLAWYAWKAIRHTLAQRGRRAATLSAPMMSHTERNARAYDQRAHEWAAAIRDDAGHKYLEKPAMEAELAGALNGRSVLCIGAGSGHELPDLLARRPARVVAIDISARLLQIAAARYPVVRFLHADMMALPFAEHSFDLVYSSLAFHYADDWDRLLAGVHRVLRPGGQLLFSTHHPGYWARKPRTGKAHTNTRGVELTEHVARLPAANVDIVYYNHADEHSIVESVRHAGFAVSACFAPQVVELSPAQYAGLDASARERYDEVKAKNRPLPLFFVVRAVKDDTI